jgi:G-patch domain
MSTSQPPIKLSLALGAKKKDASRTSKQLNGTKRPHAALHDSDDDDTPTTAQHQVVSHFDLSAGGAIDANSRPREKKPLVIPSIPNSDRLGYQRKKQKSGLPVAANEVILVDTKKEVTFGLKVPEKRPTAVEVANPDTQGETNGHDTPSPQHKTEEELAMDALLGNKPVRNRTIPTVSEEEAYRRDVEAAPEAPTLDQYMAVPVEEFGAALLRGMGWKDTETLSGSQEQHALKPRNLERRPALLGIGAKPASAVGIELGEWGKSARGKNAKQESYNPVVLRNKVTGETVTEEELKAKLEGQQNNELVIDENEPPRRSEMAARQSRRDDEKRSDRRTGRDYEDRKHHAKYDRGSGANGRQRVHTDERSRRHASTSEDERWRKRDKYNQSDGRRRDRSTSGGAKHDRPRKYDENGPDKSRSSRDKDRSRHDHRRHEQEGFRRDRSERDRERDSNRRRR